MSSPEPELEDLNALALRKGKRATIGIRVNPDVDANTHAKITTGRKENKFGIEWTRAHQVLRQCQTMDGIDLAGVAVHIGSQLTELEPFRQAFRRVRELVLTLRADGIAVRRLDLGGGLGVPYDEKNEIPPHPDEYAAIIRDCLGDLGCALVLEPGRLLVGNAGILVSRVIYVKQGASRTFIICDAAMNDLIRPAMYEAYHDIRPVTEAPAGAILLFGRRRRSGLRKRRYVCPTAITSTLGNRRLDRHRYGGRLRRHHVFDLQYSTVGAGSAGQQRVLCGGPRPTHIRRHAGA